MATATPMDSASGSPATSETKSISISPNNTTRGGAEDSPPPFKASPAIAPARISRCAGGDMGGEDQGSFGTLVDDDGRDLLPEMLVSISECLGFVDHRRMTMVSKQSIMALSDQRGPRTPLLMVSEDKGASMMLFIDLSSGLRYHSSDMGLIPPGYEFCSTSSGRWLVSIPTHDLQQDTLAWDPINGAIYHFPPLQTLTGLCKNPPHAKFISPCTETTTVLLMMLPDSDLDKMLAFARPGDASWMPFGKEDEDYTGDYTSVAFYGGCVYAWRDGWGVECWDITTTSTPILSNTWRVESAGIRDTHVVASDVRVVLVQYCVFFGKISLEEDPITRVLELDQESQAWRQAQDLAGGTIFLSQGSGTMLVEGQDSILPPHLRDRVLIAVTMEVREIYDPSNSISPYVSYMEWHLRRVSRGRVVFLNHPDKVCHRYAPMLSFHVPRRVFDPYHYTWFTTSSTFNKGWFLPTLCL